VWRILAGLEAGVWGGVWMLVWMSLSTLWQRGSFWSFSQPSRLHLLRQPRHYLKDGVDDALGYLPSLFVAGVLGTVFGLLALKLSRPRRVFLAGILFGLGWNYLASGVLWKQVNPLVPLVRSGQRRLVRPPAVRVFLAGCPDTWRRWKPT